MILRKGKVENGNSREKEKEDENSNYIHVMVLSGEQFAHSWFWLL